MNPLLPILLACTALLVGCTRNPVPDPGAGVPPAPGGNVPTSQGADADGNTMVNFTFTPALGQTFSVTLPGHGTQGYMWSLDKAFDARVVGTSGTSRMGSLPPNAAIGPSASEIFDFKAIGTGRTTLTFALARSFGDTKATETRSFTVVVP